MTETKGGRRAENGNCPQEHATGAWETSERGDLEISREEWPSFLDSFTRQHKGRLASVYVRSRAGGAVQMTNCRLENVTREKDEVRLTVMCGEVCRRYAVPNPSRITFKRDEHGRHAGLDVTSLAARGVST